MLEKIYNYYKGYVKLRVKSNQTERFLNMAANEKIYIWDLKREKENEITFFVSVKGFKRLRKTAYETASKIKIIKKAGVFNFTNKLKRRKILCISFIICIFVFSFFSSLILDIEVVGNEETKSEVILEKLREINLQKFKFRSNIDSDRISLKLINDIDNIAWVGVREEGTKLIIEIKERRLPPKIVPKDQPCHIVAKRDGIIYKMNIENGETLVTLNQVVTKGELLVSGIINTKHDGQRYVHSMGEITAKTWNEKFLEVKLYEFEKQFTGKSTVKTQLKLFSKDIDLSFGSVIPYYNSKETVKRNAFGFFEIINKTYEEYTLKRIKITKEEAIKRGEKELYENLLKEYDKDKIINVHYDVNEKDEETIIIRMLANTIEEIGDQIKINI